MLLKELDGKPKSNLFSMTHNFTDLISSNYPVANFSKVEKGDMVIMDYYNHKLWDESFKHIRSAKMYSDQYGKRVQCDMNVSNLLKSQQDEIDDCIKRTGSEMTSNTLTNQGQYMFHFLYFS